MTKKFPFLLFHLIFCQKLILDEFSEIDMKPNQNPETAIRKCSTKQMFFKILHLCWSIFCNKLVGQACNLIEKEIPVQVFSCEFQEMFKIIYLIDYLRTNDSENIYVLC